MAKHHDNDLEGGFNPADLSVRVSEMLVATADGSDELINSAVSEMLLLLRQRLAMDVVFVSEFVDGRRVFRYVDAPADRPVFAVGNSHPLEQTWCQRVVDGRLPQLVPDTRKLPDRASLPAVPFDIGTYLSTPVMLSGGRVYGTLCCFCFTPNMDIRQRDLRNLQSVALLIAKKIELSQAPGHAPTEPAPLTLAPKW